MRILLIVALLLLPAVAGSQTYSLAWDDVSAGGTAGASDSYIAMPNLGEVVAGEGSSESFGAEYSPPETIEELLPTGVDPETPPEIVTRLESNYPNPFNPHTTLRFSLAASGMVELRVYNLQGRLVRTLLHEALEAAPEHLVRWDGRDDAGARLASGVYFYRLTAGDYDEARKLVLLK